MLKKQMRPCYQCDHLESDERCKVARVLDCYYIPTPTGHQSAERPPLRFFEQRKEQRVYIADFFEEAEHDLHCLRCGRFTAPDILVCDICAQTGITEMR